MVPVTPAVEVGVRQDGGDAETGAGVELGARVSYAGDVVTVVPTAGASR